MVGAGKDDRVADVMAGHEARLVAQQRQLQSAGEGVDGVCCWCECCSQLPARVCAVDMAEKELQGEAASKRAKLKDLF